MNHASRAAQELFSLIAQTKKPTEIENLLEDLLTPQELESIAERLQIIKELIKGTPQREIAEKLNTSIGKITRGSRVVQYGKVDWGKKQERK